MKRFLGLLLLVDLAAKALATTSKIIELPIIQHTPSHLDKRFLIGDSQLYNIHSRFYVIPMFIGTPPQEFNLTVDTGSSYLWVASSSCPKSECPYGGFSEQNSTTLVQTPAEFDVLYGSGSAKGPIVQDTVHFSVSIESKNQSIGIANTTSGVATSAATSGVLGLGFSGLFSDPTQTTFIERLFSDFVIGEPVFSLVLSQEYDGKLVIGGIETEYFTGPIYFVPVINYTQQGVPNMGELFTKDDADFTYKYWTVPGQALTTTTVNGSKIYENQFPNVQPAVLDTGSTLSYFPEDVVTELLETITKDYIPIRMGDGPILAYSVNCSDFTDRDMLVNFHFSKSVTTVSKMPAQIRVPLRELVLPQTTQHLNSSTLCFFGLAPITNKSQTSLGPGWILGQSILRSAYVVYDMYGHEVGFSTPLTEYNLAPLMYSLSVTNLAGHQHYYMVFLSLLIITMNIFV